jgi:DNA-binding Lrp family transcriptional regulator
MLSDLEKKMILALQRDLEIKPRPFKDLAEQLQVAEEEMLGAIRSLMARG